MTRNVCWFALILSATVFAQSDNPKPSSPATSGGGGGGGTYTWYTPSDSGPCRLAPAFSADVVYEMEQRFVDGNRIHKVSTGKIYRDSAGRIRRDQPCLSPAGGECSQTTIVGPDEAIFLDSGSRTAHIRRHSGAPKPVKAEAKETGAGIKQTSPVGETQTTQTESLGHKSIEGFIVNGYRHTTTLPAGADGNKKPIISTSETWHSDELNEVLERIEISPWMGKHTVSVRNIQLGEPGPAAFQIPSDYAIREIGQNPVRVEDP